MVAKLPTAVASAAVEEVTEAEGAVMAAAAVVVAVEDLLQEDDTEAVLL